MYTDRERWEKRRYIIERRGMEIKQYRERWENKRYIIERRGRENRRCGEREKEREGEKRQSVD